MTSSTSNIQYQLVQRRGRATDEAKALYAANEAFPFPLGWTNLTMFFTPDGMVEWTAIGLSKEQEPT